VGDDHNIKHFGRPNGLFHKEFKAPWVYCRAKNGQTQGGYLNENDPNIVILTRQDGARRDVFSANLFYNRFC